YHCGQATQSTSCDQTPSGVAAISITFCANTSADAGACSGGPDDACIEGLRDLRHEFSPNIEVTEYAASRTKPETARYREKKRLGQSGPSCLYTVAQSDQKGSHHFAEGLGIFPGQV